MEGPMLAGTGTGAPPFALERERHHWILRGGGQWEAVAGTNFVGAARAQSIYLENQNNKNRRHTNRN